MDRGARGRPACSPTTRARRGTRPRGDGAALVSRALRASRRRRAATTSSTAPAETTRRVRPNQLLAVSLPNRAARRRSRRTRGGGRRMQTHAADAARPSLARARRPRVQAAPPRRAGRARRRLPPGNRVALAHRALRRCGARGAASPLDGILDGLDAHLGEWGLGSVSETADGAAPHAATGCPFQAWSVAEVLRVRRTLLPPDRSGAAARDAVVQRG